MIASCFWGTGVAKRRNMSWAMTSSEGGPLNLFDGLMFTMIVWGSTCWWRRKASFTSLLNRFLSCALPYFLETVIPTLGLEVWDELWRRSATNTCPYIRLPLRERRLYSVLFVTRSFFGNENCLSAREIIKREWAACVLGDDGGWWFYDHQPFSSVSGNRGSFFCGFCSVGRFFSLWATFN